MKKEFLVKKHCDQKKSSTYEFIRELEIDEEINLDSFDQFTSIEKKDKNLGFIITDKIEYLSYENRKKFYKEFLKIYKEELKENPLVYLLIKDEELKEDLEELLKESDNVIYLKNEKNKLK